MSLAFASLAVKPADPPAPPAPKGPQLTEDVRAFAVQIADAKHGLLVEGVDKKTVGIIKRTLAAHRETLFGTWIPKFRYVDDARTVLRITLAAPVEKPAESAPTA